jgi:hypothetical protein
MNDILDSLPENQKFNSKQLEGYLLKQGVSPKEIEASKLFHNMIDDNRALTISDWKHINPNAQELKRSQTDMIYEDISLGQKGINNPTYHVNEFLTKDKIEGNTNLIHKMQHSSIYDKNTQLGWNRVHQDTINGKPTTVLNELQSDWMQAERQGQGTFRSNTYNYKYTKDEALKIYQTYADKFFRSKLELDNSIKTLDEAEEVYWDNWIEFRANGPKELVEAERILNNNSIIEDFSMKPEKFQQLMIVDALNEAITNGTKRVAIPIQRENELMGGPGVTKFYQSLNQKVLPEIRKKLEKQGFRVKLSQEDYSNINLSKEEQRQLLVDSYNKLRPSAKEYLSLDEVLNAKDFNMSLMLLENTNNSFSNSVNFGNTFYDILASNSSTNKLHILEIEEVPNAKVKWDVYSLLAAIGLGGIASQSEANTKITTNDIVPQQREIETNKISKPLDNNSLDKPDIMPLKLEEINPNKFKDTNKGIKDYIAAIETRGFNNPYEAKSKTSSALGKYQFTSDMRAEIYKLTGLTNKDLLVPHNQEVAMEYLIGEYKERLEKFGLPVNKQNMFVIHNLGMTGGIRTLRGSYTQTDIDNMAKNLPTKMLTKDNSSIVNNYATYYNINIPKRKIV